jgi:hypothetical protein
LSTASTSESIYASFKFSKDFFANFDDSSRFSCKMAIKPFGNVFRMNLENLVKVILESRNDRVLVDMHCIKDVQKSHSFQFEDAFIKIPVLPPKLPNSWTAMPKMLLESLQNFPSSNSEVCLKCTSDSFTFSTVNAESNTNELLMETEIALLVQDFHKYTVTNECEMMLDFKELKRVLQVSDVFECTINASFESGPGSLIVFEMSPIEYCSAKFVIASFRQDNIRSYSNKAKKVRLSLVAHTRNM